jgi:hypothetical protein
VITGQKMTGYDSGAFASIHPRNHSPRDRLPTELPLGFGVSPWPGSSLDSHFFSSSMPKDQPIILLHPALRHDLPASSGQVFFAGASTSVHVVSSFL